MATMEGTIQVSLPNLQKWRAEAIMVNTDLEQRTLRRHMVRLPVAVRWHNGEVGGTVLGLVRDISERGVFLFLDSRIPEGSNIEFSVSLPSQIVGDTTSIFCCRGQVVRLEAPVGAKAGVGARIVEYEKVNKPKQPETVVLKAGGASSDASLASGSAPARTPSERKPAVGIVAPASPFKLADALAMFLGVLFVMVFGLLALAFKPEPTRAAVKPMGDPNVQVWVYTRTGLYHCSGTPEYGTLQPGKSMPQGEAQRGYHRPATNVCQ